MDGGRAGDKNREGGAKLAGVGYASGIGPRQWQMSGGRCSRGHTAAGGGVIDGGGCPRWWWRLAGEVAAVPCGGYGPRGPNLNN
jgi:hypothetical protein